MGNAWFFEDVEFIRGDKVRDFLLKEEYVTILSITIDNDQDQEQIPIPNLVQEAIQDQEYSKTSCSRVAFILFLRVYRSVNLKKPFF